MQALTTISGSEEFKQQLVQHALPLSAQRLRCWRNQSRAAGMGQH
jgi:hypothetical protein